MGEQLFVKWTLEEQRQNLEEVSRRDNPESFRSPKRFQALPLEIESSPLTRGRKIGGPCAKSSPTSFFISAGKNTRAALFHLDHLDW